MSIGEKLKKLRAEKTLKEVAAEVEITAQALSNYENDLRVPRDETKMKLAKYFNKSVEEIFFD